MKSVLKFTKNGRRKSEVSLIMFETEVNDLLRKKNIQKGVRS